jgi:integrase
VSRKSGPKQEASGRWSFVVDIGIDPETGKRKQVRRRGFPTRKAAQEEMDRVRVDARAGTYVAPSNQTLSEYLTAWLEVQRARLRPSTYESYERNIRTHVLPRLGGRRLDRLTAADLDGLYSDLLLRGRKIGRNTRDQAPGLSARTVNYVHVILHRALSDAVRKAMLLRNVADLADPPRQRSDQRPEMRTWTAEQSATFLEFIGADREHPAYLLALTTGMRRGEILGLRWRDVDLEGARLSIRQTVIAVDHEVVISTPKTAKGRRSVSLPPGAVTALRAHRKRQNEERLAMGAGYEDHDLVFAYGSGGPLDPEAFSQRFTRRVRASDLPMIRLHDLRHTYASIALAAGIHPKVVSEALGHANISITLDCYSHVIPAMQAEAAERVAGLIFGNSK